MKILLVNLVLTAVIAAAGSSSAAGYRDGGPGQSLQPAAPEDLVIVLNDVAGRETLKALLRKLADPDPFVRVEAVQALGEIKEDESLVSVCGCLNDDNLYVRAYAAEALGKIGHVDTTLTLSKLLPALDDPSPYVRAMMAVALGELQDERAVDSVRELLRDEDESVRKMAAWALNEIETAQ